ncbi:DUF397 domain-containing protein [Actinomadura chibensis]|uniref:DUF397 domain-containing protein n=2 Tax=Actinomadura chibensis TaxID=392828 RepID=A0A5D0NZ99_9ACTN|nr:DUF397 domain-containing protein [Actinomadura chibensis]
MEMGSIRTTWRKSSYSGANGGECIEVSSRRPHIALRDSKDVDGPELVISNNDFRHLTETLKNQ